MYLVKFDYFLVETDEEGPNRGFSNYGVTPACSPFRRSNPIKVGMRLCVMAAVQL